MTTVYRTIGYPNGENNKVLIHKNISSENCSVKLTNSQYNLLRNNLLNIKKMEDKKEMKNKKNDYFKNLLIDNIDAIIKGLNEEINKLDNKELNEEEKKLDNNIHHLRNILINKTIPIVNTLSNIHNDIKNLNNLELIQKSDTYYNNIEIIGNQRRSFMSYIISSDNEKIDEIIIIRNKCKYYIDIGIEYVSNYVYKFIDKCNDDKYFLLLDGYVNGILDREKKEIACTLLGVKLAQVGVKHILLNSTNRASYDVYYVKYNIKFIESINSDNVCLTLTK
jgi:hypothetical protein